MWTVVEPLIGNLAVHAWERVTCTRKRAEKNNTLKEFPPQGYYYIWYDDITLYKNHISLYYKVERYICLQFYTGGEGPPNC